MKVLFICLDYYPYNGACAKLLDNLFQSGNMKQMLDDIHVLTIKKSFDECDTEKINGITVHRCFLPSVVSKKHISSMFAKNPFLAVYCTIIKAFDSINAKIMGKKLFLNKSIEKSIVKKLKQLYNEKYDILIPVCGIYETAAAALKFSRKVSSKMVVYQLDPCANNYAFSNVPTQRKETFENELFEKAAAIITTPILYRYICEKYSASIIKKTESMEFPNVKVDYCDNHSKDYRSDYNCVYAGALYSFARNPRYTIEVFKAIENPKIKLHFIGADKSQLRDYIDEKKDRFIVHGIMPFDETRTKLEQADVLVNIGNIMSNQVPSKIFEYISTGKPIINVCANSNCPSKEYLDKYPMALSIVENESMLKEHAYELEKFILEYAGKAVDKNKIMKQFEKCTPEYCANQMCGMLTNVLNNRC